MPRAIVPQPDARTRIEASTVPMQGAAQTANAPPSSAFDPRRRACCSRPGATCAPATAQPDEREPDHDQHEAGDLDLRLLVDRAADRGCARAEQHEDGRETEDERHARDHDPRLTPRSPSRSTSTAEIAER